jgi:signal recognition particle receptor subunit beta
MKAVCSNDAMIDTIQEQPRSANTDVNPRQPKLVFTGSVGAGKTTAIGAISEIPPVTTEAKPSEESVLAQKRSTTVAMDYGVLTLEGGLKLHLYGTPGQRRFDFMCHILTRGALGLIVLIDNTHQDPLGELDYYLNLNAAFLRKSTAVVGVTHADIMNRPTMREYYDCLAERGDSWPVLAVDARTKRDVAMLIHTLIAQLEYC